ncbi:ABC transporter permease subunit [Escherichia coli O157]|nr:ABC transporter permease subunit [Escherichia coli O157]
MQESIQLVIDSLPFLLKGAGYTLQLSIGGMFFGLLLGFILALMRLSPIWPVRWLARFYISIFRGTPLSNSFISLVKDTSLAATIQVPELFRQAQLITSRTLEVFTMYLAASLIYWIMATVLSTLQNHFENQLNRQEREPK